MRNLRHVLFLSGALALASSPEHPAEKKPDDTSHAAPAHDPASAPASSHAETPPADAPHAEPLHGGVSKEELSGLLRIGQRKLEQGDLASAELAFTKVLSERATAEQDRDALIGLSRTYKKRGDFTKATAVYEKFIKLYPNDVMLPTVYLELGRTLRNMGAHKQAIARFYNVINSTLKIPEDGTDTYRQLARTAQFEIAETYFISGDYEQAGRFFSRLRLLDLAPEDRARAHFKSAYSLILDNDQERAVVSLKSFLELYPADENTPEARHLLAMALYRMGRFQESLAATVELLKAERSLMEKNPKRWAYWQRKTGNQLANEFYENGSFKSALQIYLSLEDLSADPIWRLTVGYQIGLCHERLLQLDQATAAYRNLIERAKASELDANQVIEANDIIQMTEWRLKHLSWQVQTEKNISEIFATAEPAAQTTPAEKPAPPPIP